VAICQNGTCIGISFGHALSGLRARWSTLMRAAVATVSGILVLAKSSAQYP
jgi:hypothetical protein